MPRPAFFVLALKFSNGIVYEIVRRPKEFRLELCLLIAQNDFQRVFDGCRYLMQYVVHPVPNDS